jgi:hypothetical protein
MNIRRRIVFILAACLASALCVAGGGEEPLSEKKLGRETEKSLKWAAVVSVAMLLLLAVCGIALWRTTRFS